MDNKKVKNLVFEMEHEMWKAAKNKDNKAFSLLVADEAIMICGGYRCLGKEYAEYIKDFCIDGYKIENEEVVYFSDDAVQIHYVIDVTAVLPEASDLGGVFHVVSLWKKVDDIWKLYFNMDSRIITDVEKSQLI